MDNLLLGTDLTDNTSTFKVCISVFFACSAACLHLSKCSVAIILNLLPFGLEFD